MRADIKHPRPQSPLATTKQHCMAFRRNTRHFPVITQESCWLLTDLALFGRLKINVVKDENLMP